jgi:hypothetical protein
VLIDNKGPLIGAVICLLVFACVILTIAFATRPSHKLRDYVNSLVEEDRSRPAGLDGGGNRDSDTQYARRLVKFPTVAEFERVVGKPVSDHKLKDYRGSEENGWRELKFKSEEGTLTAYFPNTTGRLSMLSWKYRNGYEYITNDLTEWRKQISIYPALRDRRRVPLAAVLLVLSN